jgi:hypothetical protein
MLSHSQILLPSTVIWRPSVYIETMPVTTIQKYIGIWAAFLTFNAGQPNDCDVISLFAVYNSSPQSAFGYLNHCQASIELVGSLGAALSLQTLWLTKLLSILKASNVRQCSPSAYCLISKLQNYPRPTSTFVFQPGFLQFWLESSGEHWKIGNPPYMLADPSSYDT